jgi:NTP pyrophosphatase (non-canonical NTP hydrolase)
MSDSTTTIADLKQLVNDFVGRRDWHRFHAPKNLAMSLAIEAAELMEHFQWISAEESCRAATEADRLAAVGEELADVLCYALAMANELDLDLATIIRDKMAKNEQKYPAEEYRGRYGPEDKGKGGGRKAEGGSAG